MMRKVLVIGCPGSGKSTFARALLEKHKTDKMVVIFRDRAEATAFLQNMI